MTRTFRFLPATLAGLVLSCAVARADEPKEEPPHGADQVVAQPPRGPADIMNRGNSQREAGDVAKAATTGDQAAAASSAQPTPPHAHAGRDPHAVLSEPELPSAKPKPGSAPGSIDIEVIAPGGTPLANAEIVLGVMASTSNRTEQRAKTDALGRYTFQKLAVGSGQAYRVNVMYEGGKFSSTPFRLPDDQGYAVRVPLKATTGDTSLMFQVIGQTSVELRDDRLHVTQQARLANAGESVVVLPKDGLLVPLPEGFTAFQWQEQMTDQKGEQVAGQGFKLRGSLPTGSVTLAWSYDLPRDGDSARIAVSQPWRTYTYRVITEAPDGMRVRVSDFPEPERVNDDHRQLFFTQIQRRPSDPALGAFTIKLDGIPGPGPGRWIAAVLAVLAMGFGVVRALKRGDDAADRREALAARRQQLLADAKALDAEHARGDVGPHYHAERMNEIMTELALVLRDEEQLAAPAQTASAQPARRHRPA
ncbi:MAG: carboxypeptidase-like regulatory domain-containing protein [Polyangiales bacterium]